MTAEAVGRVIVALLEKEPLGYETELLEQLAKWFNEQHTGYEIVQLGPYYWVLQAVA